MENREEKIRKIEGEYQISKKEIIGVLEILGYEIKEIFDNEFELKNLQNDMYYRVDWRGIYINPIQKTTQIEYVDMFAIYTLVGVIRKKDEDIADLDFEEEFKNEQQRTNN